MGACCTRTQTQANEYSIQYSNDDIIRTENNGKNSSIKPELKFETIKLLKSQEDIQLDIIINNIKNSFPDKTKTISEIELYNIAAYFKDNYTECDYLLFDTRRSAEQKEDFIKKMKHINYTYSQMKTIRGKKLENFASYLDNKIIIFIISEYFIDKKNNKRMVTPFEIINLIFNINKNLKIYILNNLLNKDIPKLFLTLINFLGDNKSYDFLPYILLYYKHVTTFYIDGYIFIHFINNKIFSLDSYINELNKGSTSFKGTNKFLNEMNISTIIEINNDDNLDNFKACEYQYKNKFFKLICCSKSSLISNSHKAKNICSWIKSEINKGNSIYINVENYNEEKDDWIFVVIMLLSYIINVGFLNIANYLKEKINFIHNISEKIDSVLQDNEFNEI